ncbi:MAG: limonene-1,2-epoxide hydrolase [Acidobacteria bacterium RBG_16_64_8]|nr:MAG: limonene-1,2-epoxide hydrolase [Acidobacteria bacterium RBG_16_64_8]
MTGNEEVVRDFINAWSRLDPAELDRYFTADGTYHNMPAGPVTGRENIERFIGGFLKDWSSTQWDILNIVSRGDVVIAERLDRTMVGAKAVDLPCCGIFEMQDGKIKVWRDYFDLATYTRSLRE